MLKVIRLLLWPLSLLFAVVVYFRNQLFDWGIFPSKSFDKPVIAVGNLAVGGSGKTPTVEYLLRLLDGYKVAVLSRGYGRKSKGFLLADENSDAQSIGDEPLQYYRKFPQVTVAVCEDRVEGIARLLPKHDLILLDDAYQHRWVKPGFNLLLFDWPRLIRRQWLLPSGDLREPYSGVKRAQAIWITKAPANLTDDERKKALGKLNLTKQQDLFFTQIQYLAPRALYGEGQISLTADVEVFLLSGIANPQPLLQYLSSLNIKYHHFDFPDHYAFKLADIKQLKNAFETSIVRQKIILTTEKDAQRLFGDEFKELLLNLPIYYLPIQFTLGETEKLQFDKKILDYVASFRRVN